MNSNDVQILGGRGGATGEFLTALGKAAGASGGNFLFAFGPKTPGPISPTGSGTSASGGDTSQ
jgi:hypothetical protein